MRASGIQNPGSDTEGGVGGEEERAAEGLDVAVALDRGEVGGDLLLGGGVGQ